MLINLLSVDKLDLSTRSDRFIMAKHTTCTKMYPHMKCSLACKYIILYINHQMYLTVTVLHCTLHGRSSFLAVLLFVQVDCVVCCMLFFYLRYITKACVYQNIHMQEWGIKSHDLESESNHLLSSDLT